MADPGPDPNAVVPDENRNDDISVRPLNDNHGPANADDDDSEDDEPLTNPIPMPVCRVISVASYGENPTLEHGGKVLLSTVALRQLSQVKNGIRSPMHFRITVPATGTTTHCGVHDFCATNGFCVMPSWMMEFLGVTNQDLLEIDRVQLPTATYVKFEPQSVDFLDISDSRTVLEIGLRTFACLTQGDTISIQYSGRPYKVRVVETQPSEAVSVIECDVNVDILDPVGYVPPAPKAEIVSGKEDEADKPVSFPGIGKRPNGGPVDDQTSVKKPRESGPDTKWKIGTLALHRR